MFLRVMRNKVFILQCPYDEHMTCQFTQKCPLWHDASYTCTQSPPQEHKYCGKYREFAAECATANQSVSIDSTSQASASV